MYGRKTMRNSTLAKGGLHIVYKANVSPGYQTRVRHAEDKMRQLHFAARVSSKFRHVGGSLLLHAIIRG